MTRIVESAVNIQATSESNFSPPSWLGEIVVKSQVSSDARRAQQDVRSCHFTEQAACHLTRLTHSYFCLWIWSTRHGSPPRKAGHFSAHHEWRVPKGAWRAHRHIRNHGSSLRLAPTSELTMAVLEQVAATLQAHLT